MFSGLFALRKPGPAGPAAVVDALRCAVGAAAAAAAAGDAKALARAVDELTRAVSALKVALFGAGGGGDAHAPPEEADVEELTALACAGDLLPLLARNLRAMSFETRKDAVLVFNNLLRRGAHGAPVVAEEEVDSREAGAGEAGGGGEGGVGVKAAKEGKRAVVVVAPDPATSSGLAEGDMDVAAKVAALVVGDARESAAVATDEVKCTTTVQQLAKNGGDLLTYLVSRYDDAEIALNSGAMLRECIRNETLAQLLLETNVFWRFFELVEKSDFDVASDAFTSFKAALTQHHAVAATFMLSCLERFVEQYNGLLRSSNYYTRRQSLKLLGEMLMQRANFKIMTRYISSPENLKLVMNLLLDSRKNIQFEAFHVFKVFVANPNKPAEVRQILLRNKVKMTEYLSDFLIDRDDEQFHVDRRQILEEIKALT